MNESLRYPLTRGRRNVMSENRRCMATERRLTPDNRMAPLFVMEGENQRAEIPSMPGYYRYTLDLLLKEVAEIQELGIPSVLLFAMVPDEKKDNAGTEALNPEGLMQRAVKAVKRDFHDLVVMTDVALDPYSSYGHDGVVRDGDIVNDESVTLLAGIALSHVEDGREYAAPYDMKECRG